MGIETRRRRRRLGPERGHRSPWASPSSCSRNHRHCERSLFHAQSSRKVCVFSTQTIIADSTLGGWLCYFIYLPEKSSIRFLFLFFFGDFTELTLFWCVWLMMWSYECKLCLTLHNNEGNYLAHTQGKKHQTNLAKRAAREAQEAPTQPQPHKRTVSVRRTGNYLFLLGMWLSYWRLM